MIDSKNKKNRHPSEDKKITRSERLLCGPGAGDLRKASFHPQGILIGRRLVAAQRLQSWSCDVLWSPNMASEGKKNGSTSMKIQSNAVQELYFYGFPGEKTNDDVHFRQKNSNSFWKLDAPSEALLILGKL